jgi:excisionase family DNA binding protein
MGSGDAALHLFGVCEDMAARDRVNGQPPALLEVHQVAYRLHRRPEFVRRLLRAGVLPGVHLGTRWRIEPSDLEAFVRLKLDKLTYR